MKLKYFKHTSVFVLLSVILSGCGSLPALDEVIPDNTQKYRKAETMPPLDVPPDLSTQRINDDIAGSKQSSATYSEYEEAATNPLAAKYNVTPDTKPALSGEGDERHLVVPGDRELTWQRIENFWNSRDIGIHRKDERIGLMDTNEDRDGYAYRIRMERGETSKMSEVYLSGRDDNNRIAQKDEAMLRQLADYLGVLYQQDVARIEAQQEVVAPEDTVKAILMDEAGGHQALLVEQEFATVWRRVGRVLDSKGFAVEDRDRARGFYLVRYLDPFNEIEPEDEGIFDKIAFWRDEVEKAPEEFYYIKLVSDADTTRIMVLDADETRISTDTARRLLGLIQEQLTQ